MFQINENCNGTHPKKKPPFFKAISLFSGDDHSLGIATPSIPFLLCEIEHPNPSLKLFGYLMLACFELFCKNHQ
jgi:hypothetical protein